ncbi:MAG TPA: hypothetical protein VFL70_06450 [Bacteroidia bacterium]|jgi:hypothetical protein|nr:hypothetical protein [Bacteroidia bacterium]HNO70548.1 hypothetical protein [Bacteroidia bacterium]
METQDQKSNKRKSSQVGGLMFVGCMFIGMAGGWYFGNFTIGLFAGMGLGFIMMAVTYASNMQNKS